MRSDQPLLTVFNTHAVSCGEPPHESNERPGSYLGYFENEHGDQWLFTGDPKTATATLQCGDAGWKTTYRLHSAEDLPDHLTDSERAWARACWEAALGQAPISR
jgi:hypothetical protein